MEHSTAFEAVAVAAPRLTIERAAILPALDWLCRHAAETRRPNIPCLAFVTIAPAADGGATLTACNLDMMASLTVPAQWEVPAAFAIAAEVLRDTIKKADKGAVISIEASDGKARVTHGRTSQRVNCYPVDDMPTIAAPIGEAAHRFTLSAEYVQDWAVIAPAISNDKQYYWMNGAAMEYRSGRLFTVATCGDTLAVIDRPAPDGAADMPDIIIPRPTIAAMIALAKACPASPLSVESDGSKIAMAGEGFRVVSKLIDGTFPDWLSASGVRLGEGAIEPCPIPFIDGRVQLDRVAKMEKAAGCGLSVENGVNASMLTSTDRPEYFGLVMHNTNPDAAPKGFTYGADENELQRARDYLRTLASQHGLRTDMDAGGLRCNVRTNEVFAMTFGKSEFEPGRSEKRLNWETLQEENVWIEGRNVWEDGAYSIIMPRNTEFDIRELTVQMMDDDGQWSDPQAVATKDGKEIALPADQVRHIAGADTGERVHIPALTMWKGEIIAIDGVATDGTGRRVSLPKDSTGKKVNDGLTKWNANPAAYLASLEPIYYPAADTAPIVEAEAPAPLPEEYKPEATAEAVHAFVSDDSPVEGPDTAEVVRGDAGEPEIEAGELSDDSVKLPPPPPSGEIAAIMERLAALEAVITGNSRNYEPVAKPARSPAHVRAIMAYLAMRKERAGLRSRAVTAETCVKAAEAREASAAESFCATIDRVAELQREVEALHNARAVDAGIYGRSERRRERALRLAMAIRKSARSQMFFARCQYDARGDEIARLKSELAKRPADYGEVAPDARQLNQALAQLDRVTVERDAERARADTASAKIADMESRIDAMADKMMEATGRALRAETALSAVQARADGWPPAVRAVKVSYGKAA